MHTSFVVPSEEAVDVTFAIPYKNCEFIAGYNNGNIKLLRINLQEPYGCTVIKTFVGHTQPIKYLLLLRNGDLVSAAYVFHGTTSTFRGDTRVWDITSCSCKHILKSSEPYHRAVGEVTSIAELNNDLIAIAGSRSLSWGAFDIWDIKNGKRLFLEQQPLHKPHELELGVIAGEYILLYGHCVGRIYAWKVNHHECSYICSHPGDRIYSMVTLPTEQIAAGGFELCIYDIRNQEIRKVHEVLVGNVIDDILPLSYYRLLTVDRRSPSGKVLLWDYLTAKNIFLGYLGSYSRLLIIQNTILDIRQHEFRGWISPKLLRPNKKYLEIIKNARLLSQAYRTGTGFFAELPRELNISIAALTSPEVPEASAERIATEHFCKPEGLRGMV